MKFTLAAIIGTAAIANAKLGAQTRALRAEDVGSLHTEAFLKLEEKYLDRNPSSKIELMNDVSEVLASFCEENDSACRSNSYKATMQQFHYNDKKDKLSKYVVPESLDDQVREKLNSAFNIVDTINDKNVNDKVAELSEIQNEISDLRDVAEADKIIGVASVSVGQESALYWTNTFNDKDHAFKDVLVNIEDGDRRLQVTGNLTFSQLFPLAWSDVISSDMAGAVNHSITEVNTTPNIVFNFSELILRLLAGAFPASAAVAFNTTGM